jgi:hypothetical protein
MLSYSASGLFCNPCCCFPSYVLVCFIYYIIMRYLLRSYFVQRKMSYDSAIVSNFDSAGEDLDVTCI